MKSEKDPMAGICKEFISLTGQSYEGPVLTERVIRGLASVTRKRADDGFFLGTQDPLTRSKPS